jgi:hypothetical protein
VPKTRDDPFDMMSLGCQVCRQGTGVHVTRGPQVSLKVKSAGMKGSEVTGDGESKGAALTITWSVE